MLLQAPLRVLLICPDTELREHIASIAGGLPGEAILSHITATYPTGNELARALRTYSPHLVLLSFESPDTAVAVIRYLESEAMGLPVIALNPMLNTSVMRESMRAGARGFLTPPVTAQQLVEVFHASRKLLKQAPLSYAATEHIYSFLPGKPGVGASIVAVNVSAALARLPGQKVMLADLDLTCGMLRFLLKLPGDLSIVDAMTRSSELDVAMWPQLVSHLGGRLGNLDVLHSGTVNPQGYLEAEHVQGLVDFARANYNALFFDLSGNLERHSIQIMLESRKVFMVCNPDAGSLALAREKFAFLKTLGLQSRVSLIVNRADQPLALPVEEIADQMGIPVDGIFPDDELAVHASIQKAQPVDPKCKLGLAFTEFSQRLLSRSMASRAAGVSEQSEAADRLDEVTV
ncbi:MAG: hypothetical protein ABI995_07260 [Acidobacteriota bacterium]